MCSRPNCKKKTPQLRFLTLYHDGCVGGTGTRAGHMAPQSQVYTGLPIFSHKLPSAFGEISSRQ